MLAFSFRSISFRPPLSSPRRFFIGIETADGSLQSTEPFMYSPQANIAVLSETLEFLVKDIQKGGSFKLEISEFDERPQKWFKIGKETFSVNKLDTTEIRELTLPTIYGTDAVVDVSIEASDEFKDNISETDSAGFLDATLASLEENLADELFPKKKSKRQRIERMLHLDRLNVFRTASIYHELIFALTPIVDAKDRVIDFFTWKDPQTTYMYSIILTMFMLYGRYLLAIGLIMFSIFGKKAIPYIMKPRPRLDKVKGKLHVYKRNFLFVRQLVRKIVYSYDLFRRAAEDPERVLFLETLMTLKKIAPLIAVVLFIFNLKFLLIAAYWSFLFFNTQRGKEMFVGLFVKVYKILDKYGLAIIPAKYNLMKVLEKEQEKEKEVVSDFIAPAAPVSAQKDMLSEPSTIDSLPQETVPSHTELTASPKRRAPTHFVEKTFIAYENQRWWPGKGWRSELLPGERPAWSDALGHVSLEKDNFQLPGPNWHWENGWSYVIGGKTDTEGWEYASRFKKFEDPNRKKSMVHSVRRRKWIRKCIGFDD